MSAIQAPGGSVTVETAKRWRDLAAVSFLLVCGVVWPVLVSVWTCPLTIPRNDAFAYSRIAQTLADHGTIELVGYGRMSLLGQIVIAQPLYALIDDREVAGNTFGIVMMSIAVILSYTLARRFLGPWPAIVVTLVLVLAPGVANTTPTFMTEPTFLCLGISTLLAAVLGFQSPHRAKHWLIASVVLGFGAFTVREFGVATPLTAIAALAIAGRVSRAFAAVLVGALAIACAAFYEWHQHLPALEHTSLQLEPRSLLLPGLVVCTLGFYVLPATLRPALSLLRARDRFTSAGLIITLVVAVPTMAIRHSLFLDDMLLSTGVSGQDVLSGTRPKLIPPVGWLALNAIALVGGICLVVVLIDIVRRRLRNRAPDSFFPLETFAVVYALMITGYGAFVFLDERYLWPLVVPLSIIIIGRTQGSHAQVAPTEIAPTEVSVAAPKMRGMAWLVVAPLVVLFLTSTLLNQDVAAYDAARWNAAQALVDAGAAAGQVDGGLEWEGAHSHDLPDFSDRNHPVSPEDPYYQGLWAPALRCFVVSNSSPEPGGTLLGTRTYQSQLGLRTRVLYVWLRGDQQCESQLATLRRF